MNSNYPSLNSSGAGMFVLKGMETHLVENSLTITPKVISPALY